jgi:selenide,water dikinase
MLAAVLQPLRQRFSAAQHPNVLVGLAAPDDAAVYRLNDEQAIVATVDFFTPVVDDPYAYGAIAAANALSDVYAMGGEVLFALNIAALPDDLPADIVSDILRGGADKVAEAGAAIIGGHTVKDKEPKYGLCVIGLIHPDALTAKGGARPGDVLVLTKPLGAGVITTAHKRDLATPEQVDAAVASMAHLNRAAARIAAPFHPRGGTDITGFGLLGHAYEMAAQAGVEFVFRMSAVPFLPGAVDHAREWVFPGGAFTNKEAAEAHVHFDDAIPDWQRMLLYDPETSGGLLLPIAPDRVADFVAAMHAQGENAWIVGEVRAAEQGRIEVERGERNE